MQERERCTGLETEVQVAIYVRACAHTRTHTCTHIHTHITHTHTCTHMLIHTTHVHTHTCTSTHVHIHTCTHTYLYAYVCQLYVHTYKCIYACIWHKSIHVLFQSLVEKLSLEVDKNSKLSIQLQEEGNKTNKVSMYYVYISHMCILQELIAALNDNAKIQTAYSELLSNFESQVKLYICMQFLQLPVPSQLMCCQFITEHRTIYRQRS